MKQKTPSSNKAAPLVEINPEGEITDQMLHDRGFQKGVLVSRVDARSTRKDSADVLRAIEGFNDKVVGLQQILDGAENVKTVTKGELISKWKVVQEVQKEVCV